MLIVLGDLARRAIWRNGPVATANDTAGARAQPRSGRRHPARLLDAAAPKRPHFPYWGQRVPVGGRFPVSASLSFGRLCLHRKQRTKH